MANYCRSIRGRMIPAVRVIVTASLLAAVLLVWPLSASAQKVPRLAGQRTEKPEISSLPSLLATDAGIDREIERIREQIGKLRSEGGVAGAELSVAGVPGLAARTQEAGNRERIKSELVIDLDKQIDTLSELKEIRKDNASDELERQSWKGFPEKPPFPIALLDDIRDSLLSQRLVLESSELRISLAKASWKRFSEDVKRSRKALRLAEEESSRIIGTPGEQEHRLLLDLARLQNDRNEAGLVLAELQRIAYETAVGGKRLKVAFLEEKLRTAEASSPLSREDLEKKLSELDSQRRDLETELLAAQKSEAEGRKKLDDIRAALADLSAPAEEKEQPQGPVRRLFRKLAPGQEESVSREEKIKLLKSDLEAQQAFVETARVKVTVLKARIQFVNAAEKIWHDRYWINEKRDLKDMREKLAEVTETLVRLDFVKKWADSSLASWMNLIKNQKDRIASLEQTSPAAKIQGLILNTYEERQNTTLKFIEGLGRLERLMNRLKDELDYRIRNASSSGRLKEGLQNAHSFVMMIWNTELYVASETTVVDDRSIVRPVSVTVGKVVKALILLVIGTWIAGKIGRIIQWFLTRRLQWPKSNAEPAGKVIFGVMFVGVFVVSLISVNIPLAVFTFLGGALAIGVGFGAQHIINNFISGLILLFDRSIRVGDFVEVDGQGGRVTEIGMRNARIRRFDGIDMLVPNSQFLQQKVTNWTLSDRHMRYTVSVGVAYGSPTRETERVILKAIEAHPAVLRDPQSAVLFEEFGESSLVFTGYFWMELISNRDNRMAASEIRHAISEALGKAGIVISFPQRDVHLDSSKPFEVRVLSPGAEEKT